MNNRRSNIKAYQLGDISYIKETVANINQLLEKSNDGTIGLLDIDEYQLACSQSAKYPATKFHLRLKEYKEIWLIGRASNEMILTDWETCNALRERLILERFNVIDTLLLHPGADYLFHLLTAISKAALQTGKHTLDINLITHKNHPPFPFIEINQIQANKNVSSAFFTTPPYHPSSQKDEAPTYLLTN